MLAAEEGMELCVLIILNNISQSLLFQTIYRNEEIPTASFKTYFPCLSLLAHTSTKVQKSAVSAFRFFPVDSRSVRSWL
jgi:hypothetical protein